MNDSIRIRMRHTVRPDFLFIAKPGTVLRYGETYAATANKNGAVSGICENGEALGVVPGEFDFVELPQWLADIWDREGERWRVNGAKVNAEED